MPQHGAAGALHADAVRVLTDWVAPDNDQDALRATYLAHLAENDDGMWRTCVPSHLTASLLVLDAAGTQVLLTLHRKGGFWGQFGGHCEPGDETLVAAALREGQEESGITGLALVGGAPVDLDRHQLASAFGSCGEHLDVRYAAVAPEGSVPAVSEESDDVRWFSLASLPLEAVDDLGRLADRARSALAAASRR